MVVAIEEGVEVGEEGVVERFWDGGDFMSGECGGGHGGGSFVTRLL